MFDAKVILVQFPVTVLRMCYLQMSQPRLLCPPGQVSPSRDIRVPQVCKSQDDSCGSFTVTFRLRRAINQRQIVQQEGGGRPAFRL